MAEASVAVEGLREFLRALKRYAPEVAKEFRKEARGVAGQIASDARSNASWSTRIPGAIAPTVTTRAVGVRVSKRKAPHGGLYERGNKGDGRMVRHPLFGNRNFWYSEPTRPFLQPARDANEQSATAAMLRAIENAKGKVGL